LEPFFTVANATPFSVPGLQAFVVVWLSFFLSGVTTRLPSLNVILEG
jgi:hypothetical protein